MVYHSDREEEGLVASPAPSQPHVLSSIAVVSSAASRPRLAPYVALVSVPLLWGTFTPSLKLLLDQRHAPPVILTNLVSHIIGASALALLWMCEALPRRTCVPVRDAVTDAGEARRRAALASGELGIYLFFGQLLQLVGLTGTSATANAILVQSSVVFVPLLEGGVPRDATLRVQLQQMLPSLLALGGIGYYLKTSGTLEKLFAAKAPRARTNPAGGGNPMSTAPLSTTSTARAGLAGNDSAAEGFATAYIAPTPS